MLLILALIYAGFIWLVFHKFKLLPWNGKTQSGSVTVGIAAILWLVISLNMYQPYTEDLSVFKLTTPITPRVSGRVIDVPVLPQEPLETGAVLFQIDPRPYEYEVDRLKAQLAAAEQSVSQLRAAYTGASANVESVHARYTLAKKEYKRLSDLLAQEVISQKEYDIGKRNLDAATASLDQSLAGETSARLAYEAEVDGVNTDVAAIIAQLKNAELNLEDTTVVAPADGYVIHVRLEPGTMTNPAAGPVMTFVNGGEPVLLSSFDQSTVRHMREGDEVEMALDIYPGQIFRTTVLKIGEVSGEGQLTASSQLLSADSLSGSGRTLVRFSSIESESDFTIPGGSGGAVTVYTDKGRPIAIIRRIMIRMYSWLNYL